MRFSFGLVASFLLTSHALEWEARANVPASERHHPITFANETHAFFLTGSTALSPSGTSDMYIYEESTDTWTQVMSAFPGRSFGYGVVLNEADNTKAYAGFGVSATTGAPLNDLWEFDMATLEWRELADCPGPGRRHPAMNTILLENGNWEIHVGLGDGFGGNFNDWYTYDITSDTWTKRDDFPGTNRHHPFYFSIGGMSYAGLGHSDGFTPYIERDWYVFEPSRSWTRLEDFESMGEGGNVILTQEARVAGTQFSVSFNGETLGFILSGDGDDHSWMPTGEFHSFDGETWTSLAPHPGRSRWAPGSFVMRGTARAYFTAGYDRFSGKLYNDLWRVDLEELFTNVNDEVEEGGESDPTPAPTLGGPDIDAFCFSSETLVEIQDLGFIKMKDLQLNDMVRVGRGNHYEPVYSFGHRKVEAPADFLRFSPSGLELSRDHLVFVQGKGAIPASAVETGDRLISVAEQNTTVAVTAIHRVRRQGMYAPFTYTGTIAVNGVVASNYVSFQGDSNVVILGSSFKTPFTYHWMSHTFQGPHRAWCRNLGCSQETYDTEGHSSWVSLSFRLIQNGFSTDGTATGRSLILVAFVAAICLMSKLGLLSIIGALMVFKIVQKLRRPKLV